MRRFCSIFSQLLQLFPRLEFQSAVAATKAERHMRGFTCWGQFVSMLFCQWLNDPFEGPPLSDINRKQNCSFRKLDST